MDIKSTIAAVLLCTTLTANASNAWVDLGGGVYYDSRTIVKEKHSVIAWTMYDLPEPKQTEAHSVKAVTLFHCKHWTMRTIYSVFYTGYKGQGGVDWSGYLDGTIKPIIPDSKAEALAIELCGEKI
jgi:hypothetical protein